MSFKLHFWWNSVKMVIYFTSKKKSHYLPFQKEERSKQKHSKETTSIIKKFLMAFVSFFSYYFDQNILSISINWILMGYLNEYIYLLKFRLPIAHFYLHWCLRCCMESKPIYVSHYTLRISVTSFNSICLNNLEKNYT